MKKLILLILCTFVLGCGEDLLGPEIASVTVDPETISATETGMTDEFFTVRLSVSSFDEEITSVKVFRQEPNRVDAVGEAEIDGSTVVIRNIAKTWFSGVEPGEFNIGAEVESENLSVREFDLATVTVVE